MLLRSALLLGVLALVSTSSCARPPPAKIGATRAPPPRPPVTLTYLGVAGWSLSADAGTLLFDPYVTRAPVEDDGVPLVPDAAAIAAYTPEKVDVILVGHSHYDHALDVASIARLRGGVVVGTGSTRNLAVAGGIPLEHIRVAQGGETYQLGPFAVQVVAAMHSLTGQETRDIPAGIRLPLAARDYEEGGTLQYLVRFEGRTLYFVGTANFTEQSLPAARPDVAVIAVGLRGKIPDYTCRLLRALGLPPLVLPNHFDAFRTPLKPGHMESSAETRADLDAFADEVHRCAPGTRVVVPVHLQAMAI